MHNNKARSVADEKTRNTHFGESGLVTQPDSPHVHQGVLQMENSTCSADDRRILWEQICKPEHPFLSERYLKVPYEVRGIKDLGRRYMTVIAKNSSMGSKTLQEWPLIGTHNSVSNEGQVSVGRKIWNTLSSPWRICQKKSVREQLNAGARFLDVRPYISDFKDKTPVINFHHGGFTNGAYDMNDLLSDIKGFVNDNPGEIVGVYFGHAASADKLKFPGSEEELKSDVDALFVAIKYFTDNLPKGKTVEDLRDNYDELVKNNKSILIMAETRDLHLETGDRVVIEGCCVHVVHTPRPEYDIQTGGESLHRDNFNPWEDHPDEVDERMAREDIHSRQSSGGRKSFAHLSMFPHVDAVLPRDGTKKWQTGLRPTWMQGQDICSSLTTLVPNLGEKTAEMIAWVNHLDYGMVYKMLVAFRTKDWYHTSSEDKDI